MLLLKSLRAVDALQSVRRASPPQGSVHVARAGYLLDELSRYPARWREDGETGPAMLNCSMSCSDDVAVHDGSIPRVQGEVTVRCFSCLSTPAATNKVKVI